MTEKKTSSKGYVKRCITYDGFSLTSDKNGKFFGTKGYACEVKSGALVSGAGIKYASIKGVDIDITADKKPISMLFLPYKYIGEWLEMPVIVTGAEVLVFEITQKALKTVLNHSSQASVVMLTEQTDEKNAAIILRNSIWRYGCETWIKKMVDGAFLGAGACYAHRLFLAASGVRLFYSAPYDFYNFTDSADEGGYVDLIGGIGDIKKIIAAKGGVYCFFDRQIFWIKGEGAARDFTAEKLPFEGEIVQGSATAQGEKVLFMSGDALYEISADQVREIPTSKPLKGFIPVLEVSAAATVDGYYCTGKQEDGTKKTLRISATGEVVETYYAQTLAAHNGSVYGINAAGRVFAYQEGYPMPEGCVFERKGEPFGDACDKTLKSLTLYGEGEVELTVVGKHAKRTKTATLTPAGTIFPIGIKGKTFDISITLKTAYTHLTGMQAMTLQAQA